MTLGEELRQRLAEFAEFNRWEASQPPVDRDPADILADLGVIWEWLPPEVRTQDQDPHKRGVQALHAALGHLRQ